MATKRASVPGEVDKLIAHQSRLLKAPRIAGHYARLAEQGRAAAWSLEDYLAAVLAVESNARAQSGARQRIRYAGFPAIKTITDFDFTAQPALDRAQIARLEGGYYATFLMDSSSEMKAAPSLVSHASNPLRRRFALWTVPRRTSSIATSCPLSACVISMIRIAAWMPSRVSSASFR